MSDWPDFSDREDAYKNAETADNAYAPPPPGKYSMIVDEALCKTTRDLGDRLFIIKLKVLSGPHVNRKISKVYNLERNESLPFLKGDLATFGLTMESLAGLRKTAEALLDLECEVTIQENKDFPQYPKVYINQRQESSGPRQSGGPPPHSDDDVPF